MGLPMGLAMGVPTGLAAVLAVVLAEGLTGLVSVAVERLGCLAIVTTGHRGVVGASVEKLALLMGWLPPHGRCTSKRVPRVLYGFLRFPGWQSLGDNSVGH